jgi:hypothetical protein
MKGGGSEWEVGYEGEEALGRGTFGILGGRKDYLRLGTVFSGLEFGWTITREHRLLGVLGSGARNPHEILELGSQIGSVPSW